MASVAYGPVLALAGGAHRRTPLRPWMIIQQRREATTREVNALTNQQLADRQLTGAGLLDRRTGDGGAQAKPYRSKARS
ncbi:hypothetical protein [Allokutzneria oryzae]|uniref:Uncharacterized protein n=1 Tax=Allokutzneria oryzae TaxID=1378989 RepID=A0ABV6A5S5_9PSEU